MRIKKSVIIFFLLLVLNFHVLPKATLKGGGQWTAFPINSDWVSVLGYNASFRLTIVNHLGFELGVEHEGRWLLKGIHIQLRVVKEYRYKKSWVILGMGLGIGKNHYSYNNYQKEELEGGVISSQKWLYLNEKDFGSFSASLYPFISGSYALRIIGPLYVEPELKIKFLSYGKKYAEFNPEGEPVKDLESKFIKIIPLFCLSFALRF